MKKAGAFLCAILLLVCSMLAAFPASAEGLMKDRKDFEWGIGGHNSAYPAYPERTYKEQVRLAAQMGCDIYRLNYNPTNLSMLNYLDKMVAEIQAYGMDVMLVMDDTSGTPQDVANRAKIVAGRYKKGSKYGFIKYIQVFGEVDVVALEQSGTTYVYEGDKPEHYDPKVIDEWYAKFDAALSTIRSVNPDAKTVVSFSYLHYGFLLALLERGLEWDIIGPDWYQDMGPFSKLMDRIKVAFPDHDFLICESNIMSTKNNADAPLSDWNWLLGEMHYCYNEERIIGFLFYELFDELYFLDDPNVPSREAHFGFVTCSRDGVIGEPKPIFYAVQRMLGGDPNVRPTYKTESTTAATTTSAVTTTTTARRTTDPPAAATGTTVQTTAEQTTAVSVTEPSDTSAASSSAQTTGTLAGGGVSDQETGGGASKGWIVWVVIIAVVILGAGGAGLAVYLYKKKNPSV